MSAATPVPSGVATAAATPADIRDIRGPVSIPYPWLLPLALAVAAIAVAVLGFLAVRWWRRRRAATAPVKRPDEIALERLEAARALMDPVRSREFSSAVTEAVRLYVEDRFLVSAARRTTEEFLYELLRVPGSELARHVSLLEDFLSRNDLVKFARQPLTRDEMQGLHASACRFVGDTRPRGE